MYHWSPDKTDNFLMELVALCQQLGADAIAGPVMSGAVIAASAATTASHFGTKLTALLLSKGGGGQYAPAKHCGGIRKLYLRRESKRVVLVDDVVSSGDAMIAAVREIQDNMPNAEIVGVVSGNDWYQSAFRRVKDLSSARLFGFDGKHIKERSSSDGPLDS